MKQIQFLNYKLEDKKLTLHLSDDERVVVWEIKSKKTIKGRINKQFQLLRRSLYDLAYEFTDDPTERNVIMDSLWYIWQFPRSRCVWVPDDFLRKLELKYTL